MIVNGKMLYIVQQWMEFGEPTLEMMTKAYWVHQNEILNFKFENREWDLYFWRSSTCLEMWK
jgi:hypothetical protein